MSLGPSEILVVLVVALIVLGPDRLPKAARQLGKAMAEFKKISASVQDQVSQAMQVPDEAKPPSEETTATEADAAKPRNPNTDGFKLIDGSSASPPPADQTDQTPNAEHAEPTFEQSFDMPASGGYPGADHTKSGESSESDAARETPHEEAPSSEKSEPAPKPASDDEH
jgi:Tat protein translocase TatB subunit